MEPDRWLQAKELFQAAIELSPEARTAFVQARCAGDRELLREVETLLAGHRTDSFMEEPAGAELVSEPESLPGRRIGPYRVEREIGRGGIGAVYLAARDDDAYRKQVAIKLVKRGMDSDFILQRFRNERQILAQLDHPGIAKLLDGGTAADGRPYLVMELVEGQPITTYCEERGLGLRARIELLRRVCTAVQHAHQGLVVHRDLKPANILVTREGDPKLLDFGIAKILDPTHAGETATVTAIRMLTPQYASPEQLKGQPITTASDVYSLGVLLFELLTGRRPYRVVTGTSDEIARAITEQSIERPSVAAKRKELAGDLDTIVLKALQKEPASRYGSVDQLAEDLRRYLVGLPVQARPDTLGYRAAKFVGRHRVGAASAALAVASLLAGLGAALWEARVAELERQRAEAERAQASETAAFLVDLFRVADPGRALGNAITAREIVDRGAERILADRRLPPQTHAGLSRTLGRVYFNLGLFERSRALFVSALEVRRQVLGPDSPDVGRSLNDLGTVLHRIGEVEAAEQCHREALAIFTRRFGEQHPDVGTTLHALGVAAVTRRDFDAAERFFEEALTIRRATLGERHVEVADTLNYLGIVKHGRRRLSEAEAFYQDALDIRREVLPANHPDLSASLNNLAWMRKETDPAGAVPLFREVVKIKRGLWPEGHPELATSLAGLGLAFLESGQPTQAEPIMREAVAQRRLLLPAGAWETAVSESDLGACLIAQRRYAEAEPLLLGGIEAIEAQCGPRDVRTAWALQRIVQLYESWGRPRHARPFRAKLRDLPAVGSSR